MSHHVKVPTRMLDKHLVLAAMDRMNINVKSESDVKIELDNGRVWLGFDSSWVVQGDPYYTRGTLREYYGREEQLATDMSVAYVTEEAIFHCGLQGMNLTEEVNNKDQLVLTFEG